MWRAILCGLLVLGNRVALAGGVGVGSRTVLWGETATTVSADVEGSPELWLTTSDLARATGFVLKPQGVCRDDLCFPLPKAHTTDVLRRRGKETWFNLSAWARMLKQPVAHDESLSVWYFGARPEEHRAYVSSLQAPAFTLPDREGHPHSLSEFRGRKVLLITWASW